MGDDSPVSSLVLPVLIRPVLSQVSVLEHVAEFTARLYIVCIIYVLTITVMGNPQIAWRLPKVGHLTICLFCVNCRDITGQCECSMRPLLSCWCCTTTMAEILSAHYQCEGDELGKMGWAEPAAARAGPAATDWIGSDTG